MIDYYERLQELYSRREDLKRNHIRESCGMCSLESEDVIKSSVNFSGFESATINFTDRNKAKEYAKKAMSPVPAADTKISIDVGNSVKNYLQKYLSADVEFRFQGSVMTGTNIKTYSDIDLLVITKKFVEIQGLSEAATQTHIQNLNDLRDDCIYVLYSSNVKYTVEKCAKSIKLVVGKQSVDVVPSNWYDTQKYYSLEDEAYRGIQIINAYNNTRSTNYPFFLKRQIEIKDKKCNGNYRSIVRLAKNIKQGSKLSAIKELSSYDIQSLFYNMDFSNTLRNKDAFSLVFEGRNYLSKIITREINFNTMEVIDRTRKISDRADLSMMSALCEEFKSLASNISYGG